MTIVPSLKTPGSHAVDWTSVDGDPPVLVLARKR
jgi:hypothetical protein